MKIQVKYKLGVFAFAIGIFVFCSIVWHENNTYICGHHASFLRSSHDCSRLKMINQISQYLRPAIQEYVAAKKSYPDSLQQLKSVTKIANVDFFKGVEYDFFYKNGLFFIIGHRHDTELIYINIGYGLIIENKKNVYGLRMPQI